MRHAKKHVVDEEALVEGRQPQRMLGMAHGLFAACDVDSPTGTVDIPVSHEPVLASDAAHYYANLQKRSPFPIVYNVGDMAQGWEIVERLAGHPDRFIPGHDPIVSEIYPRASNKVDAFALHLAPSRSFVK